MPELRAALLSGVRDPEPAVRARAAEGLAHYPAVETLRALIPLLRSEGPVRDAAAFSMHNWDIPGVSKALAQFLDGKDGNLRQYAARALIKTPVPSTFNSLLTMLRDTDPTLRSDAAAALGALNSKRALRALRKAESVETDEVARHSIRAALRKLAPRVDPGR
jgi:HEAT repeat protein